MCFFLAGTARARGRECTGRDSGPLRHLVYDRTKKVESATKAVSHSRVFAVLEYRKISNDWPMCYVVGVASSGKVWCFFVFLCLSEGLSRSFFAVTFCTFSKVGNSRRHST